MHHINLKEIRSHLIEFATDCLKVVHFLHFCTTLYTATNKNELNQGCYYI